MLSNSRIYIFKVIYKNKSWFEILDTNELSGSLSNVLIHGIPELSFKNIQFINTYEDQQYSCQIHINKLKYKERRTIDKNDVKVLRKKVMGQISKIQHFSYEQLHIVNDEFSLQPSTAFLLEEPNYV